MGKKPVDPANQADTDDIDNPEEPDAIDTGAPLDDGPKFVEGMRSPMDDPAHPLHHLRNA